jgi:hypothetical protein
MREFKAYITEEEQLITRNKDGEWVAYELEKVLRKSRTYLKWTGRKSSSPPGSATPTDILHKTNSRITVANPSGRLPDQENETHKTDEKK